MNSVQRRLFRAFVEAGGDMTDGRQVEGFIHFVDVQVALMPPRVKTAMELVLRADDDVRYAEVAAELALRERAAVTEAALRQRVARGMRMLVTRVHAQRTRAGGVRPSGGWRLETLASP